MKIYIIPAGWDRELVLKTVFKSGADKVCLLSAKQKKPEHVGYHESDPITADVAKEIFESLEKFTSVDLITVDYANIQDIILEISNYIKQHKEDSLIINISTGGRLLAATLMLIAHMYQVPLEWSVAENHNPKIMRLVQQGENYHNGFSHVMKLPSIPFAPKFSAKEKKFVKRIQEYNNSLTVQDFVAGATGNNENRKRSEFHYLAKKLEKQGFVKITNHKKKVSVKLTEFGHIFFT